MKKVIFVFSLFVLGILVSCNKENTALQEKMPIQETETFPTFEYSNKMVVTDELGNEATIKVFANSLEALEDHTVSDFGLFTTKEPISNFSNENITSVSDDSDGDWELDIDHLIYVEVIDMKFAKEVTGFSVRVVKNPSEIDFRGWNYSYQYGSNGVRGAFASYKKESCSKEYLKLKLSYLDDGGWFWHRLDKAKLKSEGDQWSYFSTTEYYKYRFGYKWKRDCSSNHTIEWWWWL